MGSAVKEKKEQEVVSKTSKTTNERVENTQTEELIIGICYPIGSDSIEVMNSIINRMESYNYEVEVIKLSSFIGEYYDEDFKSEAGKTVAYKELMHKIEGGDFLRDKYHNNSVLAELAIKQIREGRQKKETTDIEGRRKCYIIDSLKNLEELKLLQTIYREIFYLFSIFSPEEERKKNLDIKDLSRTEIEKIIKTDEYEDDKSGQNVRDTFINGDFFVRVSKDNMEKLDEKIARYIHLIFDTKIVTPNSDETAMYHAKSSAGNSACLSRQVGATITDKDGVTIARGWNDVPKVGGNLYQDSDVLSKRCIDLGYCSNVTERNEILGDIEKKIGAVVCSEEEKILKTTDLSPKTKEVMDIIRSSAFKNIIEYSRSIHAEMHAIIIGSQMTNNKMVGGNLYCTTYPCHNCARHIVLAGIQNIYYIEPYKKSLGIKLHGDALTEDENEIDKVRILAYDGVAPRRYLDFFSMKNERKSKDGIIIDNDIRTAIPKNRVSLQAIPTLENQAIHALVECGLIEIEEEGASS